MRYIREDLAGDLGGHVHFDILSGTSVGGIHACFFAGTADVPPLQGKLLAERWENFVLEEVVHFGVKEFMKAPATLLGSGTIEEIEEGQKRLGGIVNTRLLDFLALDHRGEADYILPKEDISEKIGRFFDRHPERVQDLVFIQIAPPSRADIGSYKQIRAELEQKTGEINGARSRIDLVPIRYVNQGHTTAELYGIYRACKIGLVTPLRDGMNLVAKEYVAAQDPDDPGVLILSRFAGAAREMPESLIVNPYHVEETADALMRAITMPAAEQR